MKYIIYAYVYRVPFNSTTYMYTALRGHQVHNKKELRGKGIKGDICVSPLIPKIHDFFYNHKVNPI